MIHAPADPVPSGDETPARAAGSGAWIIMPTYNEAENVRPISGAILEALPGATLLIVDDASPDGTGTLADELAAGDPRIRVLHRTAKTGLGRAYLDGFRVALGNGAQAVLQSDADWSHDPASLPSVLAPIEQGAADLVIGSRYVPGGRLEVDWNWFRRAVSRSGSGYARVMIGTRVRDCTSGFRCYRASSLRAARAETTTSSGYFFQIELLSRIVDSGGVVEEMPIVYVDRKLGQSKISKAIVAEAFWRTTMLGLTRLVGRRRVSGVSRT